MLSCFIKKGKRFRKKSLPSTAKTFGSTSSTVKSEALESGGWVCLIDAIGNRRDQLVVKLMLQGAKRVSEVLALTVEKIDFGKRQAQFRQLKTRGEERWLVVSLPESLVSDLKALIGDMSTGFVFQAKAGKPINHMQIYRNMKKAAITAGIKKSLHPHVMRASAIAHYKGLGVADAEIVRLTGQSCK